MSNRVGHHTALLSLWAGLLATALPATAGEGYYRFPALRGAQLVFASEGDVWAASSAGGTAIRLTTHEEEEAQLALSPDGQFVAFTARYDGAPEVYVMPVAGGPPRQVSFEGGGVETRGWTPDGRVIYTSYQGFGPAPQLIRLVDPETLARETLPLDRATDATFSADGRTVFFTISGLAQSRDNAVLYRGGAMAQLWRYTLGSEDEAVRLAADFAAPIRHPMWHDGRIYFVSDQSGADNFWSMNARGGDLRQHTRFTGWQLRSPRLDAGRIVYQRGADLFIYDLASATETPLSLSLVTDRDDARLRFLEEPLAFFDVAAMGPQGKSVAITARGRVIVAFPGDRRRVELNIPPTARARSAVVGAEGEFVYLVLDQDLRGEIWRFPADGRGEAEQLTHDSDAHIWRMYPKPDGSALVYSDKQSRLWLLDLETRAQTLIEHNQSGDDDPFDGLVWSRGGRYLAYHAQDARTIERVTVYDTTTATRHIVTRGKYTSHHPAFSSDGAWLYFLSSRNFQAAPSSPWRGRTMGTAFFNRSEVFALQLDPEAAFPFRPEDELTAKKDAEDETDAAEDVDEEEDTDEDENGFEDPEIVFAGLRERLWPVPVEPGSYSTLAANADFLFFLARDDVLGGWNSPQSLKSVAIDPRQPEMKTFAGGVRQFALSADGETLFFAQGRGEDRSFALVPSGATAPDDLSEAQLRVGDWRPGIVPAVEWEQMFLDAWRLHRDFAYDPELRGLDWEALREKYQPFVRRIGHRSELNDLFALMVAELGILHSQVRWGELPRDEENVRVAHLGAALRPVAGGLEISLIYDGERDLPDQLGPLTQPHLDVQAGDLLTAVDGRPVSSREALMRALRHKIGQQVRLDLTRDGEPFSAIIEPVSTRTASRLRYRHWVEQTRQNVAEAGDGQIGYLHLRAMGGNDLASFARDFYEHYDKDGLIIDVRGNYGGNIDSMLLTILLRQVWAFWHYPLGGATETNMQETFRGHLAVLIDDNTYSDGESFSAGVKALELGPLIGTRTAGAGIWLSGRNGLTDGGGPRIAEFPVYGLDGRWLIEGHGVAPDIEVINPPRATFAGEDAQLEAALRHLKEKIRREPIPPLVPQPLPPVGTPGQDVH